MLGWVRVMFLVSWDSGLFHADFLSLHLSERADVMGIAVTVASNCRWCSLRFPQEFQNVGALCFSVNGMRTRYYEASGTRLFAFPDNLS